MGKGVHGAVDRLEDFARKLSGNNRKTIYALKCDIRKFFDSIDKEILLRVIKTKIKDKDTLWLILEILNSFSKELRRGLPLGNVVSQLFANIYLNELDQYIKHFLKARYYLRYCDDFIILGLGHEPYELMELAYKINQFLKEHLKLSLHPNKIILRKYRQGIDFLGYVVLPHYRVVRTKTKRRIIKKIIGNSNKQSLASYLGILSHSNSHELEKEIIWLSGLAEIRF